MVNGKLTEQVMRVLNEKSADAHAIVKRSILSKSSGTAKVDKVIEQYLSTWNDTTRPGVLALACEAVGGNRDIVPLQVALSFIDATMDIHDDIIDESVMKKNRKTIYGKLGKEATLLIGDMFMVQGFYYLQKATENLPKEQTSHIMNATKDFLTEVVQAHVEEGFLKNKPTLNPEVYLKILTKKAADLEGRMRIGAIYGGGTEEQIENLSRFGRDIGILLAVKSEFVDIFEPSELSHRVKYETLPLPVLFALKNRKYKKRIEEILKQDHLSSKDCNDLVQKIYETKEINLLKSLMVNLDKDAVNATNKLFEGQTQELLQLIAASMLEDL